MPYKYIMLDRSFLTGTMYDETAYTKILFITIMLECTEGIVTATYDHLARVANLKPEAVRLGMEALMSPDPNSTSPDEEGRRIVPVEGVRNTYRIVNWAKYQPALSGDSSKPKIKVVDPVTGLQVPRMLPNGNPNPEYSKHYQRELRRVRKEQASAAAALNADMENINVNSVNSRKSKHAAGAFEPEAKNKSVNYSDGISRNSSDFEPDAENSDVNSVNFVNKRKVNESNKNPPTPREKRSRALAAQTGDPANDASWAEFERIYPRPANGRQLAKAKGRLTWDLLIANGENPEIMIEGVKRYAAWVRELGKEQYVQMVPTWLNNRSWIEEWRPAQSCEEIKAASAREADDQKVRREAHRRKSFDDYEKWIDDRARAGIKHSAFEALWRTEATATLERFKAAGMETAVKKAQLDLTDPAAMEKSKILLWKKLYKPKTPDFWEWDEKHNPNKFQ